MFEIDYDSLYYWDDVNQRLYSDIEELKNDRIDEYEGLDDGMTDWYPDDIYEINGTELIEFITK